MLLNVISDHHIVRLIQYARALFVEDNQVNRNELER